MKPEVFHPTVPETRKFGTRPTTSKNTENKPLRLALENQKLENQPEHYTLDLLLYSHRAKRAFNPESSVNAGHHANLIHGSLFSRVFLLQEYFKVGSIHLY